MSVRYGDFYKMCLNNLSAHFRREKKEDDIDDGIDAFMASRILSIVFCKSVEEIIEDFMIIGLEENNISDKEKD